MPATREPRVMDNPYYDWSPIPTRPPLRWPNDARVALCVIVNQERMEWEAPPGAFVPPSALRRGPYPAVVDIHETSQREYGNRVGGFRVMQVLERYGIPATVAIDAHTARGCPTLVREYRKRNAEFIGHGVSFSRMITERMSEEEERAYIKESLDAVAQATGTRPVGWSGMDYGESTRTPRLLAEAGVRYVCDWPNDEQPYRMKVPTGQMVALPILQDLDDVVTHLLRRVPYAWYSQMLMDAFDKLYEDGAAIPRLMALNLHPYLIGQPFRIKALERALAHIMRREGVWAATGSQIVDWYLQQTA